MAGGRGRPSDRAVQSTIQSIKEVVGGHSDDDIYAALRESNMDPNETAQKLLNQGPFHEVKRKRDKKRENADHKCFVDTKELVVQAAAPWVKSQTHWIQNGQRRAHDINQSSGPSPEFRIVRDHRFQQGAVDHRPEPGRKISANVKVFHQREAAIQSDQGYILQGAKNNSSSEVPLAKGEVQGNPERHTKPHSKDPMNRRHFSTSDTVDVPYLNSKAAVTVETIHHQVRGVTRQPSRKSVSQLHVSSSYSHANIQRGDFTSTGPSGLHSTYMSKNIQSNQRPASGTAFRGRSIGRSSSVPESSNKYHQGAASNLKAMQPNKEWKPKVIKNPSSIDVDNNGANLESPSTSKMGSDNVTDVISLCEKISHANIHGKEHVIIPEYLRVPDYEHAGLKFGSFTAGLDSDHEQTAPSPESENSEQVPDSGHLVIGVGLVDVEHDEMDEHARSSQHDPSTSTAKISISPSDEGEHMNAHEFGNADGLGLVRSDTTLIGAPDERNIRNTSSLPTFSAYGPKEPQANNDASLYGLVELNVHPQVLAASSLSYPSENPEANNGVQVFRIPQHNVHSQVLHSTSEAQSSQLTSSSPAEISLQQQLSQPHPAAQLYPPVHVQHFPNFMPYHRLVYSPVYVPPMAMPNYSTNVAYPHPSNGNNYLQMPGGSSHLTAGGMKYGPSQYKSIPVGNPSGYGNYTHPAGFTISSPGVIGGTVGLDDVNSIKYNDNDLCASAQQVETPEMWIQTPREIPALQSSPYYNLTGQAMPGAYLANLGNASFGATAQASHAQFPGLYHPQQPPSIVSPHHVVHQQVPSAVGANVGFGVAAPGPQVGAFQQSQIGHQNWRGNF